MARTITLTLRPSRTIALNLGSTDQGCLGFAPPTKAAVLQMVPFFKGEPGEPGAAAGTYPHTQSIAAAVWTVPHNLNRHPSVTTTDNLGNVIHGDVLYVDTNIVRITHGTALTGFAYCN